MQREEPKALEESKNIQKPLGEAFLSLSAGFNAGGTADFILIISVPGYFSIPGLFRSPGYGTASERRMKNGTGKRSKTDRNTGT